VGASTIRPTTYNLHRATSPYPLLTHLSRDPTFNFTAFVHASQDDLTDRIEIALSLALLHRLTDDYEHDANIMHVNLHQTGVLVLYETDPQFLCNLSY